MIEVLYLENEESKSEYKNSLNSIGTYSPYYLIEFFKCFCTGYKDLVCFKWIGKNGLILLPGYIRLIDKESEFKDFVSPYGYSGPLFSEKITDSELALFWNELKDWFIANNVVSSFIRFSLNYNTKSFPGSLKVTLKNIKGKIHSNKEEQWNKYDRKVRKNVNRALKEGLTVDIIKGQDLSEDQLKDFHNIYLKTMERRNAADEFFYGFDTFQMFSTINRNNCLFAFAKENNSITSAEMILISDDTAYSFLGGTLSEHFSNRPNDILKHEIINWLRENSYKFFVLGGGYGSDDGIFKYKRSFFPDDVVDYYTGRWIILPVIYDSILNSVKRNYIQSHNNMEDLDAKDYFPEYRKYI